MSQAINASFLKNFVARRSQGFVLNKFFSSELQYSLPRSGVSRKFAGGV